MDLGSLLLTVVSILAILWLILAALGGLVTLTATTATQAAALMRTPLFWAILGAEVGILMLAAHRWGP